MSTDQKRPASLNAKILRYQGKLIRQYPRLIIVPLMDALLSWGLLLLVAHPFIHHYQTTTSLNIALSAASTVKIIMFLAAYYFLKNLAHGFSVSTLMLQVSPHILDKKKPLKLSHALSQLTLNWKNIFSWILFLTLFSNVIMISRKLLRQSGRLQRFMSGSDYLATSLLILPCLLLQKISTKEAYRTMGQCIHKTWGDNHRLNQSFMALCFGLMGLALLPIMLYFLFGGHQPIILILCISLSVLGSLIVNISSTLTTSIILTQLHHYATHQERVCDDIAIENLLIEKIRTAHPTQLEEIITSSRC